jgi:hypothetical protein
MMPSIESPATPSPAPATVAQCRLALRGVVRARLDFFTGRPQRAFGSGGPRRAAAAAPSAQSDPGRWRKIHVEVRRSNRRRSAPTAAAIRRRAARGPGGIAPPCTSRRVQAAEYKPPCTSRRVQAAAYKPRTSCRATAGQGAGRPRSESPTRRRRRLGPLRLQSALAPRPAMSPASASAPASLPDARSGRCRRPQPCLRLLGRAPD